MPSQPGQPTNAGIVVDENSGARHIPESQRADGSTRKAIKIRPGYRPPEDVEVYKNRTAEGFRNRHKGGVIGAESVKDNSTTEQQGSAAANKNAKRREARKKAKATGETLDEEGADGNKVQDTPTKEEKPEEPLDPEAEKEKKARNLKKKLKQAKDLKDKKDGGQPLLPEQIAKVIKINELVRELAALGLDADGEPKEDLGAPVPAQTADDAAPKA